MCSTYEVSAVLWYYVRYHILNIECAVSEPFNRCMRMNNTLTRSGPLLV